MQPTGSIRSLLRKTHSSNQYAHARYRKNKVHEPGFHTFDEKLAVCFVHVRKTTREGGKLCGGIKVCQQNEKRIRYQYEQIGHL